MKIKLLLFVVIVAILLLVAIGVVRVRTMENGMAEEDSEISTPVSEPTTIEEDIVLPEEEGDSEEGISEEESPDHGLVPIEEELAPTEEDVPRFGDEDEEEVYEGDPDEAPPVFQIAPD